MVSGGSFRVRLAAAIAVGSALAFACGGKVEGGSGSASACVSGAPCECIDGTVGVQRCGSSAGPLLCMCGGSTSVSPPSSSGAIPAPGQPPQPASDAGIPNDVSGCIGSENVLVLHGDSDDYIHPGYERIVGAVWTKHPIDDRTLVSFDVEPGPGHTFSSWTPRVKAPSGGGPLTTRTYPNAARAAFADGQPGLEIIGEHRGCNTLSGTFWIHELEWSDDAVAHVLLAFEQHCERGTSALRGCLAYTAPASDAGTGP